MKKYNQYLKTWIAFVNIKAKNGFKFHELVDCEDNTSFENFKGAWGNIIIKANSINEALEIIHKGLAELNFEIIFIDKIENASSLVENNELKENVLSEIEWLLKSKFVFKISDKLFPYK